MLTSCNCSYSDGSHSLNCPFNPVHQDVPSSFHYQPSPVSVGWLCPKCLSGVAPFVQVCPCQANSIKVEVTWNSRSNYLEEKYPI